MKISTAPPEGRPDHTVDIGQSGVIDAIRHHVKEFALDLDTLVAVTGATGEFQALTALAAALAGARRVIAVAPGQRRNPRNETSFSDLFALASLAGVSERIEITGRIDPRGWRDVDILVNCPQVGPISRSVVELLPANAVIALMAEPWELRPGTIDVDACNDTHIKVAAPNLGHRSVAVLPELARLCCRLVDDAGVDARGATIAVLCDTPCGPYIERALVDSGAKVRMFPHPLLLSPDAWDAIVVALRPSDRSPMDINGLAWVSENGRGAQLVQFSGEVDRLAARYFGLRVWPSVKPPRGQLGLPMDALGRSPTIRRLVSGLKAAEAARRGMKLGHDAVGFIVDTPDDLR